jgi:hypothetical protein
MKIFPSSSTLHCILQVNMNYLPIFLDYYVEFYKAGAELKVDLIFV